MLEFIQNNYSILSFYLIIIFLIYINRKKFDFPAKFIAMYKTKLGLKLMDRLATKYREFLKIIGYIGVGVGFTGMIAIIGMMFYSLYGLIFSPQTTQGVSLVIPGIKMAHSVYIPFIQGILAIFVIATMHELSHGIIARAWRIPVLSSGIVFFGPIVGAFVEPDEKKMAKKMDIEQYSVFAAGPFMNIAFAFLFLGLMLVVAPIMTNSLYDGTMIVNIQNASPAQNYGLTLNSTIIGVNGHNINTIKDLNSQLSNINIGDNLQLKTKNINGQITSQNIVVGNKNGKPYIGILASNHQIVSSSKLSSIYHYSIKWLLEFFTWLINLSLAIGLINLLPLGPTDGGRMLQLATKSIYKNKGEKIFSNISFLSLILLLANLLLSYAKPFIM